MKKIFLIIAGACLVLMLILWGFWFADRISLKDKNEQGEKYFTPTGESLPTKDEINVFLDSNFYVYFSQGYYEGKINQKDLFNKKLSIVTNPEFPFSLLVDKNKKAIKIVPSGLLQKNTNYKIKIFSKNIKDSTFRGFPFELNFKTGEEIGENLKTDIALSLKIQNKIPASNEYFELGYLENKEAFGVIIKYPNCQLVKNKVLGYLQENGINIEEAKILWYADNGINASCVPVR